MVELLTEVRRTIELVTAIQTAAAFLVVGILLIMFALGLLYKIINTDGEPSRWMKLITWFSLIMGIVSFFSGPAIALLNNADTPIRVTSKEKIFSNLRSNSRIDWLIRLIAYDPDNQKTLSVSHLKKLGPPDLRYVFVGSYDELKGRTVAQAISMLGGNYQQGQRVSAVIFAVSGRYPITPANSRGLLQIVRKIESDPSSNIQNKLIKSETLNAEEINNLSLEEINSWSFDSHSRYFRHYCLITYRLRCEKGIFDVSKAISAINSDWHPAGAASTKQSDPCTSFPQVCDFTSWEKITQDVYENFGARVFLIENKEINDLRNRYLIDFESPDTQLIPEIGNTSQAR